MSASALPSECSPEEDLSLRAHYIMPIRRLENVYVQVREGLVEEEALKRFRPTESFFRQPYFLEFWSGWRPQEAAIWLD